MTKFMRQPGLTSDIANLAGVLSIGASVAAWALSRNFENAPGGKADRWGMYIGLWAPTFMALGSALKLGEVHSSMDRDRA
jgi:hypothetical protein